VEHRAHKRREPAARLKRDLEEDGERHGRLPVGLEVPGIRRHIILRLDRPTRLHLPKLSPIDPNDPFRGKYVALRFEQNWVNVHDLDNWKYEEELFVNLKIDAKGFAKVAGISKSKPAAGTSFVKAKVDYVSNENGLKKLYFTYPFDRLYLEETLAQEAEETYAETQQDTTQIAFALVKIKDGDAVLQDVFIDSVSITEIVKARQASK